MPRRNPETVEVSTNEAGGEGQRVHEWRSKDTPAGTIVISDPATLKVFYDPVRQRILRALYTPLSVTELGDALEESPNRLYYHVRLLEQHGLIVVADERRAGSNIERLYGRAATRYEITHELTEEGTRLAGPATDDAHARLLDRYRRLLANQENPDELRQVLTLSKQISAARAIELSQRLYELLGEYLSADAPGDPNGVRYSLLTLLLPEPAPKASK
jgi:DNA-binding transcriptional ArsR family regulator